MDYFRPRGKIVCIGNTLQSELEIVKAILDKNKDNRLPTLLLSSSNKFNELVDQVVIFNSETTISQVHNLMNSYFLFFIFNSSEEGISAVLGSILASIEYKGSIPIFIDTGPSFSPNQVKKLGKCYFHFDLSSEENQIQFTIFLENIIASLTPQSGIGVSFSHLIQIFGHSEYLFYGITSSPDLEELLNDLIDQIGAKLVNTLPEEVESLQAILLSVISGNPLSLHTISKVTSKFSITFGQDFDIHFSNSIENDLNGYKAIVVLSDVHSVQEIVPMVPRIPSLDFSDFPPDSRSDLSFELSKNESENDDEDDQRFHILGKIFSESEVYIFDDGGLPLFASHRPAGQEVCLYTGLFSAIQSMSSDLIGHSPDHLKAGDKRCVFVTRKGPNSVQLRGVAICNEGSEETAKNDLRVSLDLVHSFMLQGEPEYAINDKIQAILVKSFEKGELSNGFTVAKYQAS
jgi:hypothetical protein